MSLEDIFNGFSRVSNRTEKAVQKKMITMIEDGESKLATFNEKDLQDVYALALNKLPAKYAHKGTIVMNGQVFHKDIEIAIENAIETVFNNPKI